jgi:hypothetical protein
MAFLGGNFWQLKLQNTIFFLKLLLFTYFWQNFAKKEKADLQAKELLLRIFLVSLDDHLLK